MDTLAPPAPTRTWLSWLLPLLGTAGFAALWVIAALYADRQLSWMAVVGALDLAWMLRLGRWPRGRARAIAAIAGTAAIVLLANWWIIASHVAGALGLSAWDAAVRLGWNHAWTLAQLANGPVDLAWVAIAVVVAALTAR
ncbi:hypothetical protein [Cognatilysobacter bugurensis]|uniref:Transmembrane protein n=1 Tax=Cognatilysobacter bugurensis TaxID=543356 RepID=A0A918T4J9_9GAMM|nr:hypothetical protein [Lysobacter bugurensis]GHA89615.1 hypothetical protein GCM10007067_29370 [Lysobacter bugurensis]